MLVPQVEALLASEDYGKDLASVNNLLKKHQLLEADISAHEVRTHSQDQLVVLHLFVVVESMPAEPGLSSPSSTKDPNLTHQNQTCKLSPTKTERQQSCRTLSCNTSKKHIMMFVEVLIFSTSPVAKLELALLQHVMMDSLRDILVTTQNLQRWFWQLQNSVNGRWKRTTDPSEYPPSLLFSRPPTSFLLPLLSSLLSPFLPVSTGPSEGPERPG